MILSVFFLEQRRAYKVYLVLIIHINAYTLEIALLLLLDKQIESIIVVLW